MKKYKRVALIGLDGSGKSANISEMKKDEAFSEYQFMWVRWEPKLLGPAYWLLNRKVKRKRNSEKSVEQRKLSMEYHTKSGIKDKIFKNPIVRTIWMGLALVDYLIQFYAKTIKLLSEKKNIIFDRFYLDLFVDQGINFGYSPEKIEKQIEKYQWLFPKMDEMIYIRVSPEICYKRKDDIPNMDYLLRRYEIYEKLSQNPNWFTVDGEKVFADVYSNIKERILVEH